MNKNPIIKNFKNFPSGSYAFSPAREILTGEDEGQLIKELSEKYE